MSTTGQSAVPVPFPQGSPPVHGVRTSTHQLSALVVLPVEEEKTLKKGKRKKKSTGLARMMMDGGKTAVNNARKRVGGKKEKKKRPWHSFPARTTIQPYTKKLCVCRRIHTYVLAYSA